MSAYGLPRNSAIAAADMLATADPPDFLKWVHEQGLKVTMTLHPAAGVQPWEKPYPEMARAMGIDPATQQYVPFEITDRKFALNYLNILHHPLEQRSEE